ncbi:orotidine 5'-phosphate decarboxylase [Candidatus Daviesbacteria bacterium]|nr:orotidine 5'-phosphate decarboxylase [Candidatus Daviesbacteria bacterium]
MPTLLDKKKKYLQIALNSTPEEGEEIISQLPSSDRIIIEAGTPLIKAYGVDGIRRLKEAWQYQAETDVYIVADTKCMDRGKTEVEIARSGRASAATALGAAPIETINYFISSCEDLGLDSMVDMIGVEQPIKVFRKLKKMPNVVILHRGVDEEAFDKNKPIPYLQINKIRSSFNTMISIAGGDTIREVQRAIFNDADIVVVWKNFYSPASNTGQLAEEFLKEIK